MAISSGAFAGLLAMWILLFATLVHHIHDVRAALQPLGPVTAALCKTHDDLPGEPPAIPDHGSLPGKCPACATGKAAASLLPPAASVSIAVRDPDAAPPHTPPPRAASSPRHDPLQPRAPPEIL